MQKFCTFCDFLKLLYRHSFLYKQVWDLNLLGYPSMIFAKLSFNFNFNFNCNWSWVSLYFTLSNHPTKFFLNKHFFLPKNLLNKIFFVIFSSSNIFSRKLFFDQKLFFCQNLFLSSELSWSESWAWALSLAQLSPSLFFLCTWIFSLKSSQPQYFQSLVDFWHNREIVVRNS